VRSILNKLTPQKFDKLLKQIRELEINSTERLEGSISLIFEKAIDEPNFAVAYGKLCKELCDMKVGNDTGSATSFRWVLLKRCQVEFTKDKKNDEDLAKLKKELDEAPEDQKKLLDKTLKLQIAVAKRRSVGNIRFIGELFKLNMLTIKIIFECVIKLFGDDEDNLECLCRLFTTIGKDLDGKAKNQDAQTPKGEGKAKAQVDSYFTRLEKIRDGKKVSSRVKFMIQDVLDLRKNYWVPRRDDNNPKTIEEIHKEAQQEAEHKAMMAQQYDSQLKQRGGPPRRMPQGFGTPNQTEADGWQSVGKNNRNLNSMDPEKMKFTRQSEVKVESIQLGPGGSAFSSWGKGSIGGIRAGSVTKSSSIEGERPSTPGNRFAALSRGNDGYDRGGRRSSQEPMNKGGRLLTPNRGVKNMGRSSQEGDREAAISAARSIVHGHTRASSSPMGSRNQSRESSRNRSDRGGSSRSGSREGSQDRKRDVTPVAAAPKELSRDVVEKKSKAILEEFLGINDLKEAITCLQELNSPSMLFIFVSTCVTTVIEKNAKTRKNTGSLHYELLRQGVLTMESYCKGLGELLEFAEDMAIDIPKFYVYLGELVGPLIQDSGAVPLKALKEILGPLKDFNKAGVAAAEALKEAVSRLGIENISQQWEMSELSWSDFLTAGENPAEFAKEHGLVFGELSNDRIRSELDKMICHENREGEFVNHWIEHQVGAERAAESAFIRALMTAICTSALKDKKTNIDTSKITPRASLFNKYLDHKAERELQALYALQALVHKLDHPANLLKMFFDCLYDEDIISEEAFYQWNASDDPAEMQGKGVAKTSVQQFFQWLREAEDEDA